LRAFVVLNPSCFEIAFALSRLQMRRCSITTHRFLKPAQAQWLRAQAAIKTEAFMPRHGSGLNSRADAAGAWAARFAHAAP
jgi:hypothetical protein